MKRSLALLSLALFMVISFALAQVATAASAGEYATIINLAGRQRMLTQKMSKEMLLVAYGLEADANRAQLEKTAALFDTTLTGLIKGDSSVGLPATTNEGALRQLGKVEGLWKDFKGLVDGVVGGGSVPVEDLALQNLPLLKNMNTAVRLYEKAAKKELGMASGVVINLAGKQRMLTQKMSKEMLLLAIGHDAEGNKINLKKTASLFDKTLKGLKGGDADLGLPETGDAAIVAQLDKVAGLWSGLKPLMDKVTDVDATGASRADIEKMAELNLPLLKEMNKAVKMYEKAQ